MEKVITPAFCIDKEKLERNLARMYFFFFFFFSEDKCENLNCSLRPNLESHKVSPIFFWLLTCFFFFFFFLSFWFLSFFFLALVAGISVPFFLFLVGARGCFTKNSLRKVGSEPHLSLWLCCLFPCFFNQSLL